MHDLWLGREGDALHLEGVSVQPPLKGCLIVPGRREDGTVTDLLTLTLESATPADLADVLTTLERHLAAAQLFVERGLGEPVWLGIQLSSSDQVWRTQVISGDLELTGSGLGDLTRGRLQLRLALTRKDTFEGPEVELRLTNRNGSRVTGGLVVSNHADGEHDNHVLIDGIDVDGDLPVGFRLAVTNTSTIALCNLVVGLNVHSNPPAFEAILEAEAGSGGTTQPAGDCSGGFNKLLSWSGSGETALLTWLVSAGRVADAGGNTFRYLIRFAQPVAYEDLWLKLCVRDGAGAAVVGETDWACVRDGECLQELGPLPLPPGQLPPGAAGMPLELVLVARQAGEGAHALALDYLALVALDGYRRYLALTGLRQNGQLVDDPVGGLASYQPGSGWMASHLAVGAPLEILPGVPQRLIFFQDEVGGLAPIERRVSVRAWYRPRKRLP
jgi:hypothetical protein